MVTKGDVRQARTDFELHCAKHKCKPQECEERKQLWLRISRLALLWERS